MKQSAIKIDKEVSNMSIYSFPAEGKKHEGTWLSWPHQYTYGREHRDNVEGIWIEMVHDLHTGEKVHIIAYNETEKQRITNLLIDERINMTMIDFVIARSDDFWSRDIGPMFVYDENDVLTIINFAFDGWGKKTPYEYDDKIPVAVAKAKGYPIVTVPDFVLEGGAVELDGAGTLMTCKSSVVSKNRNPEMTVEQAEECLRKYLGATNFIWLEGVTDKDITDAHIDGTARFYDDKTLLTVSKEEFFDLYEDILESDYEKLISAKNAKGEPYKIVELPLTSKNVEGLEYKGSYLNYYIGNEVILLPVYNDVNDEVAIGILSELYEDREIIPIDVTNLYQHGGMLHCVTQQQPLGKINKV